MTVMVDRVLNIEYVADLLFVWLLQYQVAINQLIGTHQHIDLA